MNRSDLPFGSEISPQQVDLARLLALAHKNGKDWKAFEAAVGSSGPLSNMLVIGDKKVRQV